jgi:nucleoside-diphosphate-sugar epimerase
MTRPHSYVLLTGATGLLGQYLLRDLLELGYDVAVIVRSQKKAHVTQRVEQVMQHWEREWNRPLRRPVCLEGDVTARLLGLDHKSFEWVRRRCDTMLHCAASLAFHEEHGEPWRTNVEGTRNVLELCAQAGIGQMHYISTAYVCGSRHDLVYETELDVGQEFRNDYEKSKFQAEVLVRQARCFDSPTIYRPVVITGDSQTGYTSTYHGTYVYMKIAKVLAQTVEPDENGKRHIPFRWGLTGAERRNITPVDWNSAIICQLFNNPAAHGRTFHLAPAEPITMREAIQFASDFYGITGVEFCGFGTQPDTPLNELERWLWSNVSIYGSYDFMDPPFDTTNLQRFAPHPPCPRLDKTLAERLIRFAEADRWGKRKRARAEVPRTAMHELLTSTLLRRDPSDVPGEVVGLDLLGPGGAPWQVELVEDRITSVRPGLPDNRFAPVLRASTHTLEQLIRRADGLPPTQMPSGLEWSAETDGRLLNRLIAALNWSASAVADR